eukprot:TRINITY_DN17720_c0_g1_i1.p1 TRINITY_DN17720_c0_g1~~TRINITY_DN17720_c0_g1_i1.p1  ORF type:complete len:116 (+),score=16.09 TRINITY_DN17720_c0_g1_i1:60-407(+)
MAPLQTRAKTLRLFRDLLRLSYKYPESALAWESERIPMSDDLRVEIRSAFRDHADETDPERIAKYFRDGQRMQRMLQVLYQDGIFRMYPTVRQYHTWASKPTRQLEKEIREYDAY